MPFDIHACATLPALDVARSLIAGGANKFAVDKFGRSCKDAVPAGSCLYELFADA